MTYEELKKIAEKDRCEVKECDEYIEIAPKGVNKEFYDKCKTTIYYYDNEETQEDGTTITSRGNFYMPMPSMYSYDLAKAIIDFRYTPVDKKRIKELEKRNIPRRTKHYRELFMKYVFPTINNKRR